MTKEEHRQRHVALHHALDELLADFLQHHDFNKLPSNTTLVELMQWSHQQTIEPVDLPVGLVQ